MLRQSLKQSRLDFASRGWSCPWAHALRRSAGRTLRFVVVIRKFAATSKNVHLHEPWEISLSRQWFSVLIGIPMSVLVAEYSGHLFSGSQTGLSLVANGSLL
jgi:hypothetical protein